MKIIELNPNELQVIRQALLRLDYHKIERLKELDDLDYYEESVELVNKDRDTIAKLVEKINV